MSLLNSRRKKDNRKTTKFRESFEEISGDEQETETPTELPRVISMQRIVMKSKNRADQIMEKENELRRKKKLQGPSQKGGVVHTSRAIGSKSHLPKTITHSKRDDKVKESDMKRPVSVTFPYISAIPNTRRLIDSNNNQQRAHSISEGNQRSEVDQKLYNFNFKPAKRINLSPATSYEAKEFYAYPVDKDDRSRVESSFSGLELSPASCTYIMMLEENPPSSIELRNHGVSAKSISLLKNMLENGSNVRELDLESNGLNDLGVEDLGIMLRGNLHIEQLNISSNTFSSKGVIAIGHLLESNKTLRSLALARNKLTDTDLELLCSSMEDTDNSIDTLDLSFNSFTPESGNTLGKLLSTSRRLEDLNISGNNFGASGISPICEGLRENCTLKKLNLACNELSDEGMEMLSERKSLGGDLKCLDLSDNFITIKGIQDFMPILERNYSLAVLKLDNNQIGKNGLIFALECILEHENHSLTQLHVRGVFADQGIINLCNKIRKYNSEFVLLGATGNSSTDTNDALEILQLYLRKNNITASARTEHIGSIAGL